MAYRGIRLNQLSLDSNPDYWTWEADTLKKFTVQSARHIIDNHALPLGLSPTRWCSTWMAFGGNTRDLGSFGEETDKPMTLHHLSLRIVFIERGDGVVDFKQRRQDFQGDGVIDLTTASERSRLNTALEDSTWRRRHDYFKPSHEGYRITIKLLVGNNVVPLRFDTIWLVQNRCSLHGLRSEDPNQHLKDFLKLVDSLDLDVANRERTRLRGSYYSFLFSILSTGKDRKTSQRYLDVPTTSRRISLKSMDSRTIDQSASGKLRDRNAEESWTLLEDLPLYDNKSWNDPRDFAKPVKVISLPQDIPSTSDRHIIKIENQVQRLMEAHLALKQPIQVNKITSSCEICSGPHDTQYYMENPEQAFVDYTSSCTDNAGGKWYTFKPEQTILVTPTIHHGKVTRTLDARLSKFKAEFKNQQSEMTNKIDTVLKAITNRMAGALPRNTVKNPKLNANPTSPVLSAQEDEREGKGNPENTNTIECKEEQRDTPQPELKDPTATDEIGYSRNHKEKEVEWLDVKEPLDLVDTVKITMIKSVESHPILRMDLIETIKPGPEYLTRVADEGEVT
ncbi:hypothetical protein Tco_0319033 [Tanacetum coccineum]